MGTPGRGSAVGRSAALRPRVRPPYPPPRAPSLTLPRAYARERGARRRGFRPRTVARWKYDIGYRTQHTMYKGRITALASPSPTKWGRVREGEGNAAICRGRKSRRSANAGAPLPRSGEGRGPRRGPRGGGLPSGEALPGIVLRLPTTPPPLPSPALTRGRGGRRRRGQRQDPRGGKAGEAQTQNLTNYNLIKPMNSSRIFQ